MTKILILVEGQTEEAFVKNLLSPHLKNFSVRAVPVIVATKRLLTGDKMRGGYVPYGRLRSEILRLLNDSSSTCVTTMLDYYGLAPEFPGRQSPAGKTPHEKVVSVLSCDENRGGHGHQACLTRFAVQGVGSSRPFPRYYGSLPPLSGPYPQPYIPSTRIDWCRSLVLRYPRPGGIRHSPTPLGTW